MPLFLNNNPPLSSAQLTQEITFLRLNARNTFKQMLNFSNNYVQLVWLNPTFSPQVMINSLSGDAANQLNYSLNLRVYLLSVMASEGIPLSSVTFLRPTSAYSIAGSTVTLIPSAYSGP